MEFQLNHNILEKFIDLKLEINWMTIFVGRKGFDNLYPTISNEQIIEFAVQCLEENINQPNEVIKIAGLLNCELSNLDDLVEALASTSNKDEDKEIRKWRLLLLNELFKQISEYNEFDGIMTLLSFWGVFGFAKGTPLAEDKTPGGRSYFSTEHYEKVLKTHQKWLDLEKQNLQGS